MKRKIAKYEKPKIKEKKIKLSFFLPTLPFDFDLSRDVFAQGCSTCYDGCAYDCGGYDGGGYT